jgi:surface antigen
MNYFIAIGLVGADLKRYIAIALATLTLIVALPIMAVFAMGRDAAAFLIDSPSAESAQVQGFYMGGAVPGDTYAWGNCTYWVFAMRLWAHREITPLWGNANTWDEYAIRDGYEVNHTPRSGAIMQSDEGEWGHVAYVTLVDAVTGVWTISEMNAPHLNVVSLRTFSPSAATSYDFIHDKKEVAK